MCMQNTYKKKVHCSRTFLSFVSRHKDTFKNFPKCKISLFNENYDPNNHGMYEATTEVPSKVTFAIKLRKLAI